MTREYQCKLGLTISNADCVRSLHIYVRFESRNACIGIHKVLPHIAVRCPVAKPMIFLILLNDLTQDTMSRNKGTADHGACDPLPDFLGHGPNSVVLCEGVVEQL
jgi:hypothetical protein